MNSDLEEKIAKYAPAVISSMFGMFFGLVDCKTSGIPAVTVLVPVYEILGFIDYQLKNESNSPVTLSKGFSNFAKGLIPYSLGAGFSFYLHYHEAVNEYISRLL